MIKDEFPILKKNLAYLDNAATTQKPKCVIERVASFYNNSNANPHRGVYSLAVESTNVLESSRNIVAKFINASNDEIFFTKNATDAFNYLAYSFENYFNFNTTNIDNNDLNINNNNNNNNNNINNNSNTNNTNNNNNNNTNIVVSILEHHSNFLPWQNLAKKINADFIVASGNNIENEILNSINKNTKIASFTLMSNVSGRIIQAEPLIKKIRKKNKDCIIIIDAAQAIAHINIDVVLLDCDFLVFSSHKVYGPLGVGIVFGKKSRLTKLEPAMIGGGMISDFKNNIFSYVDIPNRFESGSIDVASIAGLAEAINFFTKVKNKFNIESELLKFTLTELKKIKGLTIVGHDSNLYGPVISFTLKGIHPHDLASIADSFNVCIRAGHLCAKPYLNHLCLDAVSRLSISFYNTKEDIIKLIESINHAKVIFNE